MVMSPSCTKLSPMSGEVTFLIRHLCVSPVIVDLGSLCKNADVRILFLDPIHEFFILIWLTGPHSVLNVPVKNSECLLFLWFGSCSVWSYDYCGYQ